MYVPTWLLLLVFVVWMLMLDASGRANQRPPPDPDPAWTCENCRWSRMLRDHWGPDFCPERCRKHGGWVRP